jgi:hypothetical protein
MFLKQIDLTTALRPSYLPDEILLFVQDNVGLYEGLVGMPSSYHQTWPRISDEPEANYLLSSPDGISSQISRMGKST